MHSTLQYYYSRCFRVLIICVLTFRHSSCQPMHKSLPVEEQFHFICILNFYSLCKTRTHCNQNSRLRLIILHVHKLIRLVQYFASPWYFYSKFFVWCILFADLPRYGSLNFAPDFLFLSHLVSLCISQFLHARMFILIL